MNVNFVRLLAVPIHATIALLHSVRVPGNLNMDKREQWFCRFTPSDAASVARRIRYCRLARVRLEGCFDPFTVLLVHSAIDHFEADLLQQSLHEPTHQTTIFEWRGIQ